MDVMYWIPMLRRRRVLALALLTLTMLGAVALALRPGPYRAESQVGFLPPRPSARANGGNPNPYLSFTGAVNVTADLVRRELMAPETVTKLAAAGYTASYKVVDDVDPNAPVLDITVTGGSPSAVERTLGAVNRATAATLLAAQSRLRPADRMTALVLSADPRAALALTHKARDVVIELAAGLLVSAVAIQLIDAVAGRRRSGVGRLDEPGAEGEQTAPQLLHQ